MATLIVRLGYILSFLIFNFSASAWGNSGQPGQFLRMTLLTPTPQAVSESFKAKLVELGRTKAGEVALGSLQSTGYYFNTFVSSEELKVLIPLLDGRKVTLAHIDAHSAFPELIHLIVIISLESAPSNEDDLRLSQGQLDPKASATQLEEYLKSQNFKIKTIKELPNQSSSTWQFRFDATEEDLDKILSYAISHGTFELQSNKPQLQKRKIKVRYVISKGWTGSEESTSMSWLYQLKLTPSSAGSANAIKEFLQSESVSKAGQKELGELESGRPYFHFEIQESRLSNLLFFLGQSGTLTIDRRSHWRRPSKGSVRTILEVFDVQTDLASPLSSKPDPTLERPLQLSPDAELPPATYHSTVAIVGSSNAETLTPEQDVLRVGAERFQWKIKDLETWKTSEVSLEARKADQALKIQHKIYRHPSVDISLAAGGTPTPTSFLLVGMGSVTYWRDQFIGSSPFLFQRLGVGALFSSRLSESNLAVPRSLEAYDLYFRLNSGLQHRDNGFVLSVSAQRTKVFTNTINFLGVGLSYSAALPHILDMLINWIPLFDFPKRIGFGLSYYPYVFGSENSVSRNYMGYVNGHMYFTPAFYIWGRMQGNDYKYNEKENEAVSTYLTGYGGFGYLF